MVMTYKPPTLPASLTLSASPLVTLQIMTNHQHTAASFILSASPPVTLADGLVPSAAAACDMGPIMGDDFMIPDLYGCVTKPPQQEGLARIHDQMQQGSLAAMQPTTVQVRATLL